MKRVLQADKIKIVENAEPAFIDKADFEALVALASDDVVITHADVVDGTNAVAYKTYAAEANDQVNIDLVGAKQFIKIENADVLVFGDKRDINEVIGAAPDHELHEPISKPRNWGR